jgi:hypothetical protein
MAINDQRAGQQGSVKSHPRSDRSRKGQQGDSRTNRGETEQQAVQRELEDDQGAQTNPPGPFGRG